MSDTDDVNNTETAPIVSEGTDQVNEVDEVTEYDAIETLNTDDDANNDGDNKDEIDVGDVDIKSIPKIDDLRKREDVTIQELLEYVDKYEQKVEILQAKIIKLRETKRENVKKHRGSVIDLHNRMFKKLIETESEQKTELERSQDRVKELLLEIEKLKITQASTRNGDGDNDNDEENFRSGQLQNYVDANAKLEKEVSDLKKKIKETESGLQIEKMKHERTTDSHRKSISTLHTNMFKKLLDAEDDFEDRIDKLNEELAQKDRALRMERLKNEQSDKLRRDSIQTVHNNMLTKLLDAQAEHDEKEEKLQNEIKDLKAQLRKEILRSSARDDKRREKYDSDSEEEDVSDLETEQETRKSKAEKKQQFDDLWDEADEPEAEIDRLKAHIEKIERELKEEKEKNVYIEKQRKDSIHNLHNNMFQKLLDAEFEYEEEIERLHREKEELNEKIIFYEDAFEKMNKSENSQEQKPIINPTEVIQLKEELKTKNDTIDDNKQRIFHLTQKIEKLELQIENEQKQRRGSVSFLSKQMMAKLLEAEEENEEQKKIFKQKLQRLEAELEESKEMSFNLEKTRRNSVTKVSQTMFHKLLQAEQTKKQLVEGYEQKIKDLENQLANKELESETAKSKVQMNEIEVSRYKKKQTEMELELTDLKKDAQNKEKKRRESFSQLQNSYWKKLLEAEDDHGVQIKKLKHEIVRLRAEMNNLKKTIELLTTSKLNLIMECNKQMNDLRQAVTIYNKAESSSSWF